MCSNQRCLSHVARSAGACRVWDRHQDHCANSNPHFDCEICKPQGGVLDDISKQMGLWAQLRHIAGELRAIRGGGAARKASALRAMLRCVFVLAHSNVYRHHHRAAAQRWRAARHPRRRCRSQALSPARHAQVCISLDCLFMTVERQQSVQHCRSVGKTIVCASQIRPLQRLSLAAIFISCPSICILLLQSRRRMCRTGQPGGAVPPGPGRAADGHRAGRVLCLQVCALAAAPRLPHVRR